MILEVRVLLLPPLVKGRLPQSLKTNINLILNDRAFAAFKNYPIDDDYIRKSKIPKMNVDFDSNADLEKIYNALKTGMVIVINAPRTDQLNFLRVFRFRH